MLIQTSRVFKVSSDDAGDYAGSLNRDETVSGWEDLRGDPTIRLGDRVLLCRHRWIRGHGFDWPNLYNKLVNWVVRVIRQQDPTELGVGYIQVQLEESYGYKTEGDEPTWWRARDVIRLWPDTFATCRECLETVQVPPKTPYDAVPQLCERCSSQKRQKPPKGPIQEIEDAKFIDCLDAQVARDKVRI